MGKVLTGTVKLGSGKDTLKMALWGNTVTPTNAVTTVPHASYKGTGSTWSTTHELPTATGYTQGGKTLTVGGPTQATSHQKITATSVQWTALTATTYGATVHDTTFTGTTPIVVCYLSFGGAQTVTGGTLTVVPSATGILELNC